METPMWTKALNEWLPSKEEQKYLQMAAGAALLGRGNAKNIVALVGVSNTGKSTYLNTIKNVFGGYEGQLPSTAIVQKYGGNTNFEQATARGIRLLWLSEPQNTKTDDAFLKNLAGGGEAITTSEKGKDSVSWKAQCVLHIASNHNPKISTDDDAIVQRMNIVAFNHVFKPGPDMVVGLEDELFANEAEGILMWIIMGAGLYIKNRMQIIVPESIKKRAEDNVVESSAPLRWLADVQAERTYKVDVDIAQTKMVKPKEAYFDFQQWCVEKGEKTTPSQKQWLKEVEASTGRKTPDGRPGGSARVWGLVHVPVGERALSALPDDEQYWSIVAGAQ
jgi:putative DNA primase/helicase